MMDAEKLFQEYWEQYKKQSYCVNMTNEEFSHTYKIAYAAWMDGYERAKEEYLDIPYIYVKKN